MRVYMLTNPTTQLPIGVFSSYETIMDLVPKLFYGYSLNDYAECIEEFELDPLEEKLNDGVYPWFIYIDMVNQSTVIRPLEKLFYEEKIEYNQGRFAYAYVFAPNEEEAENRASELWMDYQCGENPIQAIKVFTVRIDSMGDVESVHRDVAYTQETNISPSIKENSQYIDVRLTANDAEEAIRIAKEEYVKKLNSD